MNAIVYQRYGSPDVLRHEQREKPVPSGNDVLVDVHASSINSWDWDLVRGRPFLARLPGGLRAPEHEILGADIAGVVESVGPNVRELQPGDEVFGDISGCGWGGFAEYACARERVLAIKPASMTFEQAAAIPQAAVLALQGLRKGRIQAGQRVLVNGAGGGVGTFAVQMAKARGATVTAVDSTPKLDMLRALGADHVIDYTQQDFTRDGQQYDLILDVVAHRSIFDYQRALRPNGSFVMIGGSTSRILQVVTLGPLVSRISGKHLELLMHKPSPQDLDDIAELFEAGTVTSIIDRRYPLHEVPDALRYFGAGHVQGKIIITM